MYNISPVISFPLFCVHLVLSVIALCLCLLSFVAIVRTKKTPYPTKLFSLGLLIYDCLFIISAFAGKFYAHEENFVFVQLARGFQMAAQFIVLFMSFERLFVFNWPYAFLRIGTRGRIRKVCIAVIMFSFLQYIIFQGIACYSRGKAVVCIPERFIYYFVICTVTPICSILIYIKIFRIIRNRRVGMTDLRQYKGTTASFVFLINSAVTVVTFNSLAIYYVIIRIKGLTFKGQLTNFADIAYLLNCIVDPLIYVIWFKEARMEVLKHFSKICHCLQPTVERMRREVFGVMPFRDIQVGGTP